MKVIPPLTITDAILTSSTVAEPDTGETAWVSGTTYAVDDVRILTSTHRKYQRAIAGAGTTAPNLDTTNWVDIGPTNKWAMFDLLRNSATTATTSMSVVLTPGKRIDSIALVGLQASSVTVTVKVGATVYYTKTISTIVRNTVSYYTYLIGTFRYTPSLVQFDLPPISGCTITIDFTGGSILCGGVVLGQQVYIGRVLSGARSKALNFSKTERDAFGNVSLTVRRSVPTTEQTLIANTSDVDLLRQVRSDLNGAPALWSGRDADTYSDFFESLLILGIYRTFEIELTTKATVTLDLEEI